MNNNSRNTNLTFAILTLVLAVFLITAGCSKKEGPAETKQAPSNIAQSFSQTNACEKASCITIQKSALGKIFLLIASGVTGGSTPQWYDLKPQVVSFEKAGQKIALIGQNYNSIYEEIPSANLIQTFALVSESEDSLTFDWGGGLKSFIAQGAYDIDAARGNNNDLTESSYSSIPVLDSFVRKIKFDEKNIEIEQVSKVPSVNMKKNSTSNGLAVENREETIVMNLQIRAYNLDPDFQPKEYDSSRRVGFFVTKLSKKSYSKEVRNLISKWDLNPQRGPIRIRISSTVPEDYVQAVTEGAYYWNKVFGRDVITVESGVKPSEASPQDRSIMIRWIDWLDAGAAYAISQSDPLTGEILRAQVFLPSVFTRVGSADLVHLNGKVPVVANGAIACDFSRTLADLQKISKEATGSQRLRLAQDSVRATVAHELGHAFGLRHNFAGSYSAKVSFKELQESAKTYLQDVNHPGLETSTSIMDYVSGIDNILMSARLKNAPLSYDKMAMDWAYTSLPSSLFLNESVSKYCTDEDIALAVSNGMAIYGCERFDAGNNPLERKYNQVKDEKENIVNVLFTSIIGRTYPADRPQVILNLEQVLQDTAKWGKADFTALDFVGKALFGIKKDGMMTASFASLYNIKNGEVLISKLGRDAFLRSALDAHVLALGGYSSLLNGLLKNESGQIDIDWFDRQVARLQNSGYLQKGKTLGGREYEFTADQQAMILDFFHKMSKLNKENLFASINYILPKLGEYEAQEDGKPALMSSSLPMGMINQEQAENLKDLALDLLMVESSDVGGHINKTQGEVVELHKRFLEVSTRMTMLKMLSSSGLSFPMELHRAKVKESLLAQLNQLLKNVWDVDLYQLDKKQRVELLTTLFDRGLIDSDAKNWLNEEFKIIEVLEL